MLSHETIGRIQPTDPRLLVQAQARLDRLTKPIGSLGRLEELAARFVMITGEMKPKVPRGAVYTFAADHGVTVEGVSAYPSAVTPQMVLNFLRGGAGVNVLARHVGIEVRVVDIGVAFDFEAAPGLIHKKVMPGTKNLLVEPAMSPTQAEQALQVGIELATEAAQQSIGLIGTGEMGIGNTTASSAIAAVMTRQPASEVTGRGTGIDDASHVHKINVIQRALDLHRLDELDLHGPFDIILAGDMIEHLNNPGIVLRQLLPLAAEASLVLSTPNSFGLPHLIRYARGQAVDGNDHVLSFNIFTLRNLLRRHSSIVLYRIRASLLMDMGGESLNQAKITTLPFQIVQSLCR